MALFNARIQCIAANEESKSIVNSTHDWLQGVLPNATITFNKLSFTCQPHIDSGCDLELVLPFSKIRELELKQRTADPIIVDLPYGNSQTLYSTSLGK